MATRMKNKMVSTRSRIRVPILSIDQSYTNTGFAIIGDDTQKYQGQALFWTSLIFKESARNRIKRQGLREVLAKILHDHHPKAVVVERVRYHRNGKLSLGAALALATITACIIDVVYEFDSSIPIYQIDTQDWKRAVLRPGERSGKQGTMDWIAALLGSPINDDNICDALAMGFAAYQNPHLLKSVTL